MTAKMFAFSNNYITQFDKDFFILLRAGLWHKNEESLSDNPDWEYIYRLASEQAVVGIVGDGISVLNVNTSMPSEWFERFVSDSASIVKANIALNQLQSQLLKLFEENHITAIVIKGLGLAQNYPNPGVRSCGDIDFLLPKEDYQKAKELLTPMATYISAEYKKNMHWGAAINGMEVELHGTALSFFLDKADKMLLKMQDVMFENKRFLEKTADHGKTYFYTPGYEMDIHYTFFHILKHLAQGLGIRQICDLACMLNAYNGKYDTISLQDKINRMGLSKYWKIIMSFSVDLLGLPKDKAPMYDSSYSKYDTILWNHIKNSGNLGSTQKQRLSGKGKFVSIKTKITDFISFAPISRKLAFRRFREMLKNWIQSACLRILNM